MFAKMKIDNVHVSSDIRVKSIIVIAILNKQKP